MAVNWAPNANYNPYGWGQPTQQPPVPPMMPGYGPPVGYPPPPPLVPNYYLPQLPPPPPTLPSVPPAQPEALKSAAPAREASPAQSSMVGGSKEAEMKELEAFLKALGQGGTPTGKPGEGPALPGAPGGMPDLASLGLSQQLGEIPSWAAPNPDGGIRDLSNGSGSTSFFTWPKIIIGAGLAAAAAWYLRGKGEGGGILQGIKNLWARLTGKASVVTEETKNLQKTTQ